MMTLSGTTLSKMTIIMKSLSRMIQRNKTQKNDTFQNDLGIIHTQNSNIKIVTLSGILSKRFC